MSNDYFAQLFGAVEDGNYSEDMLEKEASIALLEKIADANDVDLSDLDLSSMSEDEVNQVLGALIGDDEGEYEDEGEGEGEDIDKESAAELLGFLAEAGVDEENLFKTAAAMGLVDTTELEKEAEIEYSGRRMAQYYVDELLEMDQEMKKQAGALTYEDEDEGEYFDKEASAEQEAEYIGRRAALYYLDSLQKEAGSYEDEGDDEFDDAAAELAAHWVSEYGLDKESSIDDALQGRALEMLVDAGYIDPADLG